MKSLTCARTHTIVWLGAFLFATFLLAHDANAEEEWPEMLPQADQCATMAITIGTPGGFNLSAVALLSDRWGLEISGGQVPQTSNDAAYGAEGGLVYRLRSSPRHFSVLFLNAGHSIIRNHAQGWDYRWDYGGFGFIYKSKALYLQVGLSAGNGDFSNPQIMAQLGVALFSLKRR